MPQQRSKGRSTAYGYSRFPAQPVAAALDVARLLLERGAQVDLRNENGTTAPEEPVLLARVEYMKNGGRRRRARRADQQRVC